MSKAEKMFNELGYEKTLQTQYEIIYKLKRHNLWRTITFKKIGYWSYSTEEKILIGGEYEYKGLSIYEPLHQAITQQMKELGWLE